MAPVSDRLVFQRVRNRVIELMDLYSSPEAMARLGAFECVNLYDDVLPIPESTSPGLYSVRELDALSSVDVAFEAAAEVAQENTWDASWFTAQREWVALSNAARQANLIFADRGPFSEDVELDGYP